MHARTREPARWRWLAALTLAAAAQAWPQVPGRCETPVAEREGEVGCYLVASVPVGPLPARPLYWHIYRWPDGAPAPPPAARRSLVQAHGASWLVAIEPARWRSPTGERVGRVGPLPIWRPAAAYVARYMEAVTPPGMKTRAHMHAGTEAFYMLGGRQCVLTPGGAEVLGPGQSGGATPPDTPMTLVSIGEEMRRSLVLVLHDADRPWMTMLDWTAPEAPCLSR